MTDQTLKTQRLVLASGNAGKIREFQSLLSNKGFDIVSQSELGIEGADETGLSFVENALLKARHASAQSGLPAIADDSGLAVDALMGKPGIYSARFAGEGATDADNVDKLLSTMEGLVTPDRTARFHCVLAYVRSAEDPVPIICHGHWEGSILHQRRGEGGFGYDPIFYLADRDCSAAELSKEDKNTISHRGKAMQQLLEQFHEYGIGA